MTVQPVDARVEVAGIAEETNGLGHAILQATTDMAEALTGKAIGVAVRVVDVSAAHVAVVRATTQDEIRSEVPRTDRVTQEEVTDRGPTGVAEIGQLGTIPFELRP